MTACLIWFSRHKKEQVEERGKERYCILDFLANVTSFVHTPWAPAMGQVLVVAEVVPIELVISKTSVVLEFSETSLDPSVSHDITLFNPGNAVAEYLWGNSGAFECRPEKGSIRPGQTSVVSVIWMPAPGKRNDEEIGLHIPNGIDQVGVRAYPHTCTPIRWTDAHARTHTYFTQLFNNHKTLHCGVTK